ncbi:invasion associated locus B family protein [Fertoebacter nigrum]|uniref:Invasion associated locus B family protein n=2 Tax=Fertoeibacter niger TaxID=2656921 RepID=A0A8X8KMW1_9RHOB|nr:invasion associated locus B family protein [Fertoeibacter niger]
MLMTDVTKLFAVTLLIGLGATASAQETTAPATEAPATEPPAEGAAPVNPIDDLSMGQEADDGPGSTYIAAEHGDWQQRCIRTEDGSDPCQLYQLLTDAQGNAVAEISMFGLPAGGQAVAGATIIAPLETLLTANLALQVDSATAKVYPFTWCSQLGCVARVGFTQAEVDGFKRGNKATITIVPMVAPDEKVLLDVSLIGFTAGFDAVNATTGN